MKKQGRWIADLVCICAILGIFAVSALVLANVGMKVYKNIAVSNLENFEIRTSLLYISNKIKQSDSVECISIKQKDNIKLLSLIEKNDGNEFETLIYHYNGRLYELYHENNEDYSFTDGMEVMNIENFGIEMIRDNILRVNASNHKGESQSMILMLRAGR